MNFTALRLSYAQTGFFSTLVAGYISGDEKLTPFLKHPVSMDGIRQSIESRKQFNTNRQLLVAALQQQYNNIPVTDAVKENIHKLSSPNTFTICTAHQPNIFTGPLYFLYKILHAAKLADTLKKELPQYDFVPVYYMGSEDADLDELNNITIQGNKLVWQTKQTGAVGRMKVDDELLKLIHAINGQIAVLPNGKELEQLFTECYRKGTAIQQATFELVNKLLGEFGVIVLIPDNTDLKKAFIPVVKKELFEGFSHSLVEATADELEKHYKVQASGRDINLFYLIDDKRERIEKNSGQYTISSLQLSFTEDEILKELEEHPERFSANVILRGVFQETILPNIAFIGGGGEVAYWLELKKVFEAVNVPYPMLVLRNSFLLMNEEQKRKTEKLELSIADLFKTELELISQLVKKRTANDLSLNNEVASLQKIYNQLKQKAEPVDKTLLPHIESLLTKAQKRVEELEKKILSSEKRKYEAEQRQIQSLKQTLFPNNSLQERVENIAYFYGVYGKQLLNVLYENSLSLEQEFVVLNA
ncbi:MAG: bacillithiol biosynthesis cysteine-adding enzyme BshC [Sphingobacteriales bacterium]|nr:bacillithiol biosynthesis cysteine-adding enzyme BshC [Sphingobacteriales bacterium]MBI3719328.1 bacillithiol biosynthesis cysteine-adding enzyme BshC [Sphingobacteriales bacterium]